MSITTLIERLKYGTCEQDIYEGLEELLELYKAEQKDLITKSQAVDLVRFYEANPQHFSFENLIEDIENEKPAVESAKEKEEDYGREVKAKKRKGTGMTREKANNIARGIADKIEATTDIDDWAEFWGFTRDDYEEFLDMAIKASERESCKDAISRQAVLDMAEDMTDQFGNKHRVVTEGLISMLPPVIPKPKIDVLDEIKAEMGKHRLKTKSIDPYDLVGDCLDIIDKCEEEEKEEEIWPTLNL